METKNKDIKTEASTRTKVSQELSISLLDTTRLPREITARRTECVERLGLALVLETNQYSEPCKIEELGQQNIPCLERSLDSWLSDVGDDRLPSLDGVGAAHRASR